MRGGGFISMWHNLWEFIQSKSSLLWMLVASVLGRLIYHSGQVQMGTRKFWSKDLALEMPVAFGMGFMAHSVAIAWGLSPDAQTGLIVLAGYLGPRGIDSLVTKYIEKKAGG